MEAILQHLNFRITDVPSRIHTYSELDFSIRTRPKSWSKKEILGHLCDSALTNLQIFVRSQYESQPYSVLKYAQNHWVELMNYQNLSIDHILALWVMLNKQVAVVIANIPEDKLLYLCDIGEEKLVTLEWLIKDYVEHLEHHLEQIFST
ncbi:MULTISPECIES: DinB family protein [Paenibacillus]|uniref:DinB family protein n=1 Tax=Paenibacillus TaxID=44249 RepID=UPI000D89112F|nr:MULTISPECIES: DinB family protein [Paenibacillus]KAF6585997.1 DinB family protein [Paenibacillus sp. EKM211P]MDU8672310.1 DinB family protein [Paenibacillus polymyxa]MDU8697218.1 DinB family protein [Paenibacillus polymyxa]MEE4576666.1 DinB family protein [Paenibacillus polymyxa]URJ56398.1 DinB family protein [Paenibacillus polymyxa]